MQWIVGLDYSDEEENLDAKVSLCFSFCHAPHRLYLAEHRSDHHI